MNMWQILIIAVVLFAVGVGTALIRKRRLSAAREPDLNAEIPKVADEAVKWAAEKGVTLDYAPESVERVEGLLAALHERHAGGGLSEDEVVKYAVRYGAYVGEVIRRMHGGSWAADHEVAGPGSFPIRWGDNGQQSFPIGWCRKRIALGEEDNVWFKFRVLVLGEGKDEMPTIPPDGADNP